MNAVTAKKPDLRLSSTPAAPPADRGRVMEPHEVAEEIFHKKVSGKWILENAPHHLRGKFGRLIVFMEYDMIEFRNSLFGRGES